MLGLESQLSDFLRPTGALFSLYGRHVEWVIFLFVATVCIIGHLAVDWP